MKKFLKEIYLENKFKENSDDLKNCMKLLDLNSIDSDEKINKSKINLFLFIKSYYTKSFGIETFSTRIKKK